MLMENQFRIRTAPREEGGEWNIYRFRDGPLIQLNHPEMVVLTMESPSAIYRRDDGLNLTADGTNLRNLTQHPALDSGTDSRLHSLDSYSIEGAIRTRRFM